MMEMQCKNCQHFRRHYGLDNKKLFALNCGHCTIKRAGRKYPDRKACEQFTPCEAVVGQFVTREYLSKELLKYMLNLDLLPEIEERNEA